VRERLGALRLGANLERWFTIGSNNHPRRLGRAWWRGFKGAGFDHVRLFIPDVAYTGDGPGIAEMYREAAADAVSAGLPVLVGLSDFFKHGEPWGDRHWKALEDRAAVFARTDPSHIVLAPVNESAFPDAPAWTPVRDRLLGVVRRAAPHPRLGRPRMGELEVPAPDDAPRRPQHHGRGARLRGRRRQRRRGAVRAGRRLARAARANGARGGTGRRREPPGGPRRLGGRPAAKPAHAAAVAAARRLVGLHPRRALAVAAGRERCPVPRIARRAEV
jgi:hypothetical protein